MHFTLVIDMFSVNSAQFKIAMDGDLLKTETWFGDAGQVAESLPSMHEVLGQIHSTE